MIFLYLFVLLAVLLMLVGPFLEEVPANEEAQFDAFDGEMKKQDVAFKKEMIRESLNDLEQDLKSEKISNEQYEAIKAEIYAQASEEMKEG